MTTWKRTIWLFWTLCAAFAAASVPTTFAQDQTARVVDGGAQTGSASTPAESPSANAASLTNASGNDAAAPTTPVVPVMSQTRFPDEEARPDAARDNAPSFPGYRYWMAPGNSIDHWPWGDGKYLPIKASDFKEWLSTTQRRGALQDYVDGVRFPGVVSTLRMTATLNGDTLEGDGALVTTAYPLDEMNDSADSRLSTPPMAAFDVAAFYQEDFSGPFEDQLATYPDGGLYLPSADARTRNFRWSQRGKLDSSGNLYYEFDFQSVFRAELILQTPANTVVTVSGGVATPYVAPGAVQSSEGTRSWRAIFHGRAQTRVTVVRETPANVSSGALGYRQESSYRVSLSGVEVSTRFDFERVPNRLGEATLVLEPPLSFLTMEWGTTSARPVATTVAEDGSTHVRVRVPTNLPGDAPSSLRVTTFCPIWFGERRVPTVQLESPNLVWHETLMRLAVAEPLTATSIETIDSAQARDANRTRAEGVNYTLFKLFDPLGGVRLTLRRRVVAPPFDSATDCYFAANEVSAKTTLFFNLDGVERNRVSIPLALGWDVDSVQSTQNESLAWSRELDDAGRRSLALTFKNPPVPGQPTRVTLAARYVAPVEERLPVDRLCPLELQDSLDGAHALSVRTDSSSQVRYSTRAGKPFVPAKASPDFIFGESLLREATPLAPGGARLWLGDQTVDAFASLENVRSNYSVGLSCECKLMENQLLETWRLHCVPSSGMRVDRIVFFVSNPNQKNDKDDVASSLGWSWSTSIEPSRLYEAPRLSQEETAALHAPENCLAYEIRLATSRSVPFDLNVFCPVPATRNLDVPLIFFPESTGQTVELVVESNSSALFKTRGQAIDESTVPGSGNDSWFLKKAFRYDPTALFGASNDVETTDAPAEENAADAGTDEPDEQTALAAHASASSVVPRLELSLIDRSDAATGDVLPLNSLCWFENFDSYFQTDGVVHHCATFYLENRGRDSVRIGFTLPPDPNANDEEYADDFMQPDPWRDEALGESSFFTGALDAYSEWEYVGHGAVYDSINAVWTDDARAPWTLWKLPSVPNSPERYVLDVRLLAKRRYVRVELDYCDSTGKRLSGSRRVRPIRFECDTPVLSGVWNAWLPPQFQTRQTYFQKLSSRRGFGSRARSLFDASFFRRHDRNELELVADRVASRLGNEFALKMAVGEARRAEAASLKTPEEDKTGEEQTASGESKTDETKETAESSAPEFDALRIDAPTWGDVFGSPRIVSSLFAPEAAQDDEPQPELDENRALTVDSPFGKLEGVRLPTTFLLDRYALVSVGVSPNAPLPSVEGKNYEERANRILDNSNLKLLIVEPGLALLTTGEALSRQYGSEVVSLCGPAICAPASRAAARRIRVEILDPDSRRFISPETWRFLVDSTNPWVKTGFDASDGSSVRGWTLASIPIGRASDGVYIVNRYVLIALEFFGFVGFVVFFWRRGLTSYRFLLGTVGVCLAVMVPARYELLALTHGVFYGASALFLFHVFGFVVKPPKGKSKNKGQGSSGDSPVAESEAVAATSPKRRKKSRSRREPGNDESLSSEGFVDFGRMSPEEYHYVQNGPSATRRDPNAKSPAPNAPDGKPAVPNAPDGASSTPSDRNGKTSMKTLIAILATSLALAAATVWAKSPDGPTASVSPAPAAGQGTASASSAPASVAPSSFAPGSVQKPSEAPATEIPAPNAETTSVDPDGEPYEEPYRVFVPTDSDSKPTGEYYWIDSEFYDIVRSDLRSKPRERSWRIVEALYQGVVNYNSFSKTTSIFSLKATYTVVMDAPSATITLPAVQLTSGGGARFDKQTVPASYNEEGTEISFEIQAEPGVHTFELSLVPPQFFETTSRLAIPILPVSSARLDLEVSVDAPELDAPGAVGKIERTPRRFTAELGPIDQLVITKAETSSRSEKTELDVEQLFLMRPRATQADVRAAFRCQAIGGELQTLEIECDPNFSFSGYCQCDVGEIESVDSPTAANSAMRVVFKSPVSGSFTVNVDFVARNFSGVGRLPIPRVSTRDARVVRNWLAISPDPGVECAARQGESGLGAAFQNAWGPVESPIVDAFDLSTIDPATLIDVRLARQEPSTVETTTCVFSPAFTQTTLDATLEAESDVFRLQLDAPDPFVVDSFTVTDESGAIVAGASQTLSEDGVCLVFDTALRGKYSIKVVGRTRRSIDRDGTFPLMKIRDAACAQRFVRVYCAPNVFLEWKNIPADWIALGPESFANLGEEPADVCAVDVYDLSPNLDPDAPTETDAAADGALAPPTPEQNAAPEPALPTVAVHMNVPAIAGIERLFLYPVSDYSSQGKGGDVWKAAYQLRFRVTSGRLDQIYVVADDLYLLDPTPATSSFTAKETTSPSGVKAIQFTPQRPLSVDGAEIELFFTATFKNDPSGVCLPRFQTTPSSLYEDYSSVVRTAFLATLHGQTTIDWTRRNMRKENDPRLDLARKQSERTSGLVPGVRAMAVNGATRKVGDDDPDDADGTIGPIPEDAPFPVAVDQATRVGSVYFERFACGEDASARLSSQSDRTKVELARYSFFVNERREIFGGAVFMVKPGASDSCVVVAPPGYHVLEARVNGARRLVERAPDVVSDPLLEPESAGVVDETKSADAAPSSVATALDESASRPTRWLVELGGSPYVKRLEISFQTSGAASTNATLFKTLRRRSETFDVDFLRLEDAEVDRVLWICAFEDFDSDKGDARWTVSQRSLIDSDGEPSERVVSRECVPARVNQSGGALCRVGLEDAAALLRAYESDSAFLSGARSDDLERMKARWLAAWSESAAAMTPYLTTRNSASAAAMNDSLLPAIVVVNDGEFLPADQVDSNFPLPNWSNARVGQIEAAKERVFSSSGVDSKSILDGGASASSSQSLWTLHNAAYARVLLGSTNERVDRVEIASKPKAFDFLASPYAAAIFILMATAACLQLLSPKSRAKGVRGYYHLAFMFVWAVCFFLFGWTLVALIGAFAFATVPFVWDSYKRRKDAALAERAAREPEHDPLATTIAAAPPVLSREEAIPDATPDVTPDATTQSLDYEFGNEPFNEGGDD